MTSTDAIRRATVASCPVCQHYLGRRLRVLAVAVCRLADRHGLDPQDLLNRYLWSVHRRHQSGESLSTRPITGRVVAGEGITVTKQRTCNGCGRGLGDAHPSEVLAMEAGEPLADVTLECGCHGQETAA